jgi:hypothetical protein
MDFIHVLKKVIDEVINFVEGMGMSLIIAQLMPEFIHMFFVLLSGFLLAVVLHFVKRYLRKKYPY